MNTFKWVDEHTIAMCFVVAIVTRDCILLDVYTAIKVLFFLNFVCQNFRLIFIIIFFSSRKGEVNI